MIKIPNLYDIFNRLLLLFGANIFFFIRYLFICFRFWLKYLKQTKTCKNSHMHDNTWQLFKNIFELKDWTQFVQESAVPGINAEKVLGKHKNAFSVINKSSCVGVDYQPPTPAPVQHIGKNLAHILCIKNIWFILLFLDEDDEDNKPPRKMPAMIKPQNNTRLPPNMENPRPASKPRPPPPSKEPWNNMAPPITPHMHRAAGRPVPPVRNTPPLNNYNGHPPTQKGRNPSLSNLKIDPKMNTSIEVI